MKLTEKLKEEFEGWLLSPDILLNNTSLNNPVYLSDVMEFLPLSMQFALLCDFLEGKGIVTCVQLDYDAVDNSHCIITYNSNYTEIDHDWHPTKKEAIEKAIEYLNENYGS